MSARFHTTRWSLVTASRGADEGARRALDELCEIYWPAVYAWLRRRGHSEEDSADVTQGFFADLLARGDLGRADAARGRFRTWLLACLRNFESNERARAAAKKRGGDRTLPAGSLERLEDDHAAPRDEWSPERAFERRYALSLLAHTHDALRREYDARGQRDVFDRLSPFLQEDAGVEFRELAEAAGVTENAARVALHRLRRRFGERLRAEIAETLGSDREADVEEELGRLREALAFDR